MSIPATPPAAMHYPYQPIEILLQQFKPATGPDYDRYRNHVYRVFLNCLIMDPDKSHEEKYAVAAVFHDIGIWTDHTIDYLDPSMAELEIYLADTGKQAWTDECSRMIQWHHKVSTYKGPYEQTVEVFRKADWIDVSLGLLTYGVDKKEIRANRKRLPNKGFHWFLLKKILKNWARHPLDPLPMFRR